jgi:hypothetical protein
MGRSRQRTPNTGGESTCEWRYVFVRHDIAAILQNRWREPVRRVGHRCIRRTCLDYVIVINATVDRNQPVGLIVNQRDALIVISTLPLRSALTECRVRDLESTSRV